MLNFSNHIYFLLVNPRPHIACGRVKVHVHVLGLNPRPHIACGRVKVHVHVLGLNPRPHIACGRVKVHVHVLGLIACVCVYWLAFGVTLNCIFSNNGRTCTKLQ